MRLGDGDGDGFVGVVGEFLEEGEGLGGDDAAGGRAFGLGGGDGASAEGESSAVGGDHLELLAVALHQDAVDRVAGVLAGGGEECFVDEAVDDAGLGVEDVFGFGSGFAAGDVGEGGEFGEFGGGVAVDRELGVGAGDGARVCVGFECEGGVVVLGADDLAEFVCGDEGGTGVQDLNGHGGDADGDLAVGRFEEEGAGFFGTCCGEFDAGELRLGRAGVDDAGDDTDGVEESIAITDDLHGDPQIQVVTGIAQDMRAVGGECTPDGGEGGEET